MNTNRSTFRKLPPTNKTQVREKNQSKRLEGDDRPSKAEKPITNREKSQPECFTTMKSKGHENVIFSVLTKENIQKLHLVLLM